MPKYTDENVDRCIAAMRLALAELELSTLSDPPEHEVTGPLHTPVVTAPPAPPPPVVVAPPATAPVRAILPPIDQIQEGVPLTWRMPISGRELGFVPAKVIRGQIITPTDRWGMALNGEVGRPDLSRYVFIDCRIVGGRYAVYLEGEENVLFIGCTLDCSPPAPAGLNEEAIVRLQTVDGIGFIGCTLLDRTGPKHAFRVHKFARDIVLADSTIETWGNGFYLGTYRGQSEESDVADVEIDRVTATLRATGPNVDEFNTGVGGLRRIHARDLHMRVASPTWQPPASNPTLGWVFERFTRGGL